MGSSDVIDFVSELQEIDISSNHLTFDDLFTSLYLFDTLNEKENPALEQSIQVSSICDCEIEEAAR